MSLEKLLNPPSKTDTPTLPACSNSRPLALGQHGNYARLVQSRRFLGVFRRVTAAVGRSHCSFSQKSNVKVLQLVILVYYYIRRLWNQMRSKVSFLWKASWICKWTSLPCSSNAPTSWFWWLKFSIFSRPPSIVLCRFLLVPKEVLNQSSLEEAQRVPLMHLQCLFYLIQCHFKGF